MKLWPAPATNSYVYMPIESKLDELSGGVFSPVIHQNPSKKVP